MRRFELCALLFGVLVLVSCGGGEQETTSDATVKPLIEPQVQSVSIRAQAPNNLKWGAVASMHQSRLGHAMIELPSGPNGLGLSTGAGKVMVIGGFDSEPLAYPSVPANPLASCEIYDPATGTWTFAAPHPVPGGWRWATVLSNGMVLVAGGTQTLPATFASSHLYDPRTDRWIETRPLPIGTNNPHAFMHPVVLPNGQVLIAGGEDANSVVGTELLHSRSSYLFTLNEKHPAQSSWDYTRTLNGEITQMPEARTTSALLLMRDGRVLNAGGLGPAFQGNVAATNTASIYDPQTGRWRSATPMPPVLGLAEDEMITASLPTSPGSRWAPMSANLDDGQVLIAGGWAGVQFEVIRKSALLYDPRTDEWHITTPTQYRHYVGSWAGRLPSGGVLFAGAGFSDSYQVVDTAGEIYHPTTKTWTAVPGAGAPSLSVDSFESQLIVLSTGALQTSGGTDASSSLGLSGSWTFGTLNK
jgi:hypothetical protein